MSQLPAPWVTWDKAVVPYLVLAQVRKSPGIPGECFAA